MIMYLSYLADCEEARLLLRVSYTLRMATAYRSPFSRYEICTQYLPGERLVLQSLRTFLSTSHVQAFSGPR